jgi:hypothetical protein
MTPETAASQPVTNRYDRMEVAGAFRDSGTLALFVALSAAIAQVGSLDNPKRENLNSGVGAQSILANLAVTCHSRSAFSSSSAWGLGRASCSL